MLPRYICGYDSAPQDYDYWLSPLHAERFKRFGRQKLAWRMRKEKRPMLIVLHLFADDLEGLKHWLDMIYQLAAPDMNGKKIEFFVDDIFATYVFQWSGYTICRNDSSYSIESPPLIYGLSAAGEVHFFGTVNGPKTPSLDNLNEFCNQLLTESLIQPLGIENNLNVPNVDLASFNELIYGGEQSDVVICFYSSYMLGMRETEDFLQNVERLAARLQQEEVNIFKMNVQTDCPPKKFNIQSTPTMLLLPHAQKHKPLRYFDICHDISGMLKFVAKHASKELSYYDRQGFFKLHAELLKQIRNSFKEEDLDKWISGHY